MCPDVNFPVTYAIRRDPAPGVKTASSSGQDRPEDHPHRYQQRVLAVPRLVAGNRSRRHQRYRRPAQRAALSAGRAPSTAGSKATRPTTASPNRQCEQLVNATHTGVILARADRGPGRVGEARHARRPTAGVPRVADGTLVAPDRLTWPAIPGVHYAGAVQWLGERDFGPRVEDNAGVIDKLFPDILSTHRTWCRRWMRSAMTCAGVRHPLVAVPVATLTGWNTRTPEFGGDDLCDLLGSTIPLPRTAEAGQSQPTIHGLRWTSCITTEADYVRKVTGGGAAAATAAPDAARGCGS